MNIKEQIKDILSLRYIVIERYFLDTRFPATRLNAHNLFCKKEI